MQALSQENERLRREVNESKHLASKLVKEYPVILCYFLISLTVQKYQLDEEWSFLP